MSLDITLDPFSLNDFPTTPVPANKSANTLFVWVPATVVIVSVRKSISEYLEPM